MDTSASTFRRCCRTCMLQGHNFHSFSDYADNTKIDEMLAMVVPQLLIISTEPLPTQLCAVCLNTLHSAFKFQQMCIASEKSLRNILCTDFCTSLPSTSTSTTMGQQERNPVLEEQFIKIESEDLAEKSFENIEPVDVSTTHPSAIEATSQEKDPLLEENFIKCENYEMMETNIESESDAARDVSGADKECRDSLKATGVVDVERMSSLLKRKHYTTGHENNDFSTQMPQEFESIINQKEILKSLSKIDERLNQLEDKMDNMKGDIVEENAKILSILKQFIKKNVTLPDKREFPVKNAADLETLNRNIMIEPEHYVNIIRAIVLPQGLYNNFDRLFDLEVILQYNFDGVNQKKSFKEFQALNSAIFDAIQTEGFNQHEYDKLIRHCFKNHKARYYRKMSYDKNKSQLSSN